MNGRVQKGSVSIAVSTTLLLLSILTGMSPVGAESPGQHQALLPVRTHATFPQAGNVRSKEGLARGKFLVASRQIGDPRFSETVILLVDYDWHGSMGLIINRPTDVKLSTLLPEINGIEQRKDTVYIGGPVSTNQMVILIRSHSKPERSRPVFEDIYLSFNPAILHQMIDDADEKEGFRIYAGYTGWAPKQLEREVSRGDWHVLQADAETVFNKVPSDIWPELIRRSTVQWARVQTK